MFKKIFDETLKMLNFLELTIKEVKYETVFTFTVYIYNENKLPFSKL